MATQIKINFLTPNGSNDISLSGQVQIPLVGDVVRIGDYRYRVTGTELQLCIEDTSSVIYAVYLEGGAYITNKDHARALKVVAA